MMAVGTRNGEGALTLRQRDTRIQCLRSRFVRGAKALECDVQPLNYVPFFNRVSGTGGLMFRAW